MAPPRSRTLVVLAAIAIVSLNLLRLAIYADSATLRVLFLVGFAASVIWLVSISRQARHRSRS